jgi:molybdopterin-guanine dinucleotide biosynthesis protein B/molybdopterin-guanine dinucleotide biosynthesis protein
MTSHPNDTVRIGVLIAGGSGRRAGVDKRFLVLGGRALLVRNIAFLRSVFPTVAVSLGAGQTLDLGDAGDAEVVHDAWPGASPLAGIASALARYRRPVFALAADITFPDREAIRRVLAAFPGHELALPAIGRENHQPLFAVYGPACLAPMTALLEAGRHRIVEILPSLDAAEVRFPDDSLFHNINTMDDYQEARRRATAGGNAPTGDTVAQPALVAIVGKSDAGKTTLIEKVVPELVKLGLRVGTVKHDAHSFEIDHPGKDSWRHGQAGARAYAIASPEQLAFITKLDTEMPLADIARRFFAGFDLVLAEGYKRTAPHRVELFRVGAGHAEPLCGPGEAIALVTDAELQHEHRFGLEDGADLAGFLAVRLDSLRAY